METGILHHSYLNIFYKEGKNSDLAGDFTLFRTKHRFHVQNEQPDDRKIDHDVGEVKDRKVEPAVPEDVVDDTAVDKTVVNIGETGTDKDPGGEHVTELLEVDNIDQYAGYEKKLQPFKVLVQK